MDPSHPGSVTTRDEALARAKLLYSAVKVDQVRETPRYWVVPVQEIGCVGVVVEKASGETTALGSAWDLDTWLWGYDKGLVRRGTAIQDEPDVMDLVVTEVFDLESAARILEQLRISHPKGRRA